MPAHLPARPGSVRGQEGLRRRRLRRLHGLAGRPAVSFLPGAGLPRGRPEDHDHRGPRRRRQASSHPAGVPRRPGLPVRLLRGRHDDDDGVGGLRRSPQGRPAACAQGQHLPLHRLPLDRRCAARAPEHRGGRRRAGAGRQPAQSLHRRHPDGPGALHDGRRHGRDAAPQGAALAARPCAGQEHRQDQARSPSPASSPSSPGRTCRGGSTARRCTRTTWSTPTTPTCSTTSPASSASGSPPWSATARRPPKPACAPWPSTTRSCRRCSTRWRPWSPAPRVLHDKSEVASDNGNVFCTLQGEIGDVAQGFAEAEAIHENTYSTSRVQHVHLETHGSIAWQGEDGRWHVRTSSQGPFAVRTKLAYLMGVPPARSTSSPNGSAAASAASRRWSPRICRCSRP